MLVVTSTLPSPAPSCPNICHRYYPKATEHKDLSHLEKKISVDPAAETVRSKPLWEHWVPMHQMEQVRLFFRVSRVDKVRTGQDGECTDTHWFPPAQACTHLSLSIRMAVQIMSVNWKTNNYDLPRTVGGKPRTRGPSFAEGPSEETLLVHMPW